MVSKIDSAGSSRGEGQYGPSINILVVFADGKEARIYGKPGDPIQSLKQGEVIDVIDDNGKLKYVQAAPLPAPTGVAVINQEKAEAEKPDLAAIAFEISSIYTQAYIDIYNKLIEAEIPHDNATAATSTIFIQVFQKLR